MSTVEITMLALCVDGEGARQAVRRLSAIGIGADRIGAVANRREAGSSSLSVPDGGTLLSSRGDIGTDGALVQALVGLGVPEPDARAALDGVRQGDALVVARVARDEADRARRILDEAAGGAAPPWREGRGGADVARGYAVAPEDTAEAGAAGLRPRVRDPIAGRGSDTGPRVHRNLTATGTSAPVDAGGRSGADTGAGSHPLAGATAADVDPATGGLGLTGEAGSASPSRSRVRVAVYGGHTEPILASQYAGDKPGG